MRDDHMCDDKRIKELPTHEIEDALQNGFVFIERDGPDAAFWLTLRLEVELVIRRLGLSYE